MKLVFFGFICFNFLLFFFLQVGIITEDKVFRIFTPAEVRDYLDEAN